MKKITVVKWIADRDVTPDMVVSFGTMGGWFGKDGRDRWGTYYNALTEEAKPYALAVRDNVIANDHFRTGEDHQEADDGIPVFSDGTIGSFSWRGWGDLMAAIASYKDKKKHHYMEYYM